MPSVIIDTSAAILTRTILGAFIDIRLTQGSSPPSWALTLRFPLRVYPAAGAIFTGVLFAGVTRFIAKFSCPAFITRAKSVRASLGHALSLGAGVARLAER